MTINKRIECYKAIEAQRGCPLIVYATSTRPNAQAPMAGDAVRELIDQVSVIPQEETSVDVLINSSGGDALAAWKIMATLRERFDNVGVLVPYEAFSAATIFSLGADEIVMHPNASLGPIDPQIQVRQKDGSVKSFAYEEIAALLNFLHEDVKLSEQSYITTVISNLFSTVDPLDIGGAKRASELSAVVGERLLSMHLRDKEKAKRIAVNLNKSFFSHGDAITRKRARELELQIAESDRDLENLIWDIYLKIEEHMKLRTPFDPLAIFISDPRCQSSLSPRAPVNLPPDTPLPVLEQTWKVVANQAIIKSQSAGLEVDYSLIHAIVESSRLASECRSEGKISASRQLSGKINVEVIKHRAGWQPVSFD